MIPGRIEMRVKGPVGRVMRRHHARIMRASFEVAGATYHERFMAKHFTTLGAREYNYTPRSGERAGVGSKAFFRSYTGRKQKEKGHTRPLVWTGASELLAKIRDIRATSKRARIVQHARGLNRRNPRSEVNPAEEIQRTTERERRVVRVTFKRTYGRRARAVREVERKRIT